MSNLDQFIEELELEQQEDVEELVTREDWEAYLYNLECGDR